VIAWKSFTMCHNQIDCEMYPKSFNHSDEYLLCQNYSEMHVGYLVLCKYVYGCKPVVLAVIKLRLSEGINQLLSQSISQSVIRKYR